MGQGVQAWSLRHTWGIASFRGVGWPTRTFQRSPAMVRRPHVVRGSAAETGSLGGEHQVSKQGPLCGLQQASDTAVSGTSRSCPHGACILTGRQWGNGKTTK